MSAEGSGENATAQPRDVSESAEAAAAHVDSPYNLRSRRNESELAPGAGAVAFPGSPGGTGAPTTTTFFSVDRRAENSEEEFVDASEIHVEVTHASSNDDRYETRSRASISDHVETEPRSKSALQSHTGRGADKVGSRGQRHTSPPRFEDMTWENMDAYRRIHASFQKRAQEERAARDLSRPNEPSDRRDPLDRSKGTEWSKDEGRCESEVPGFIALPATGATPGEKGAHPKMWLGNFATPAAVL